MAKLLRIRDYVMLAAAGVGEVFEEIRLVGGLLPGAMEARYGWVPPQYKRASYMATVSSLLRTGYIGREINSKGEVYISLSSKGFERIKRKFSLLQMAKLKWDGAFMVVVFDIPEQARKDRDVLRGKLQELGFGMLQESVWISPYHFEEDLREFLEAQQLTESVFVLTAKEAWVKDFKRLAMKVWKLHRVNPMYRKVIALVNEADEEKEGKRTALIQEAHKIYLTALSQDPFLPRQLLPDDWARGTALNLLNHAIK